MSTFEASDVAENELDSRSPPQTISNSPCQSRAIGDSFQVDLINANGSSDTSLQDAFLKFRRNRQRDVLLARELKLRQHDIQRDVGHKDALRHKFIDQAKKYFGVPYARKYWSAETPEYDSPLFLDCCGLVRQVLRDLQLDFGFRIESWNQVYMHDTLPMTVEHEEDMKPGDLVFVAATYNKPKAKQQRHLLTHVEIWLGDGPKTIGARWNNGKVQVFDHYKFDAKSYHSPTYILKSIDTWLEGICQSHCPEHPWKVSRYDPGKRSIFSPDQFDDEDEKASISSSDDDEDFDKGSNISVPEKAPDDDVPVLASHLIDKEMNSVSAGDATSSQN